MKVAFLGSNIFSVEILKCILDCSHEVVAVICNEDKKAGRGNRLISPPIKDFAISKNIKVYQFDKIRNHVDILKQIGMDIMVTAYFSQILTPDVLNVCPVYNIHPSLLPKYRGASPIKSAILNGDSITGVTIMKTDAGIDTGDIFLQEEVYIDEEDDDYSLSYKLSRIGGKMIVKALDLIQNGQIELKKQGDNFTLTKMIKSEDGRLDFSLSAKELRNKIRALGENPGTYFYMDNTKVKVYKAEICHLEERTIPGMIIRRKDSLVIACNGDALLIKEIQEPGGKRLLIKDYLNGKKILPESAR